MALLDRARHKLPQRPVLSLSTPSGGAKDYSSPQIRVEHAGGDSFGLVVDGRFPAGWQGALAWGLSEARINVVRGWSARDGFGVWHGELLIERGPNGAPPLELNFLQMIQTPAPPTHERLFLTRFALDLVPEYSGSLELEVHGPDSVGFLATLLGCCAAARLYPLELHVETHDGNVFDRLWLKARDGSSPTPRTRAALKRLLGRQTGE